MGLLAVTPITSSRSQPVTESAELVPAVSIWHLVVAVVAVLYGASLRLAQDSLAQQAGLAGNAWDQAASVLFDPYLVCYFVLPLWLIWSATQTGLQAQPQLLLRSGSRLAWLGRFYLASIARAFGLTGILLAAAVATGVGLDWETTWSPLALEPQFANFTAYPITQLGMVPIAAVLTQTVFLSVGLAGFAGVLAVVRLAHSGDMWQYAIAAVMWLCCVITLHLPTSVALANLSDSLLVHLATFDYGSLPAGLAAILWMPAVAAIWPACRTRRIRLPRTRTILFGSLAAILVLVTVATSTAQNVPGAALEALYGGAFGSAQIWRYAVFALLTLIPVWLSAAHINEVLHGTIHTELIRSRSRLSWWAGKLGRQIAGSASYLTAVFLAVLAAAAIGLGQHAEPITAPSLGIQAYQWIVNGTMQLAFYLSAIFLARWLAGHEAAPLVCAGLIMAAGLPQLNPDAWTPLMLNSLAYTEAGWPAILTITAQLAGADLIVITSTAIIITRTHLKERNL